MPQIFLTDFVDIVSKAGLPKVTKIKQVKDRPDYEPAFDFYKPLRERIIDIHRSGQGKKSLSNIISDLTDQKKMNNYTALISGYTKWWGRKTLQWFSPPRDVYSVNGFDIIINPELGLILNGKRHIIKLYFKSDSLSSLRVDIITDLMEYQLRNRVEPTDSFSLLDVRNSKLFTSTQGSYSSITLVNAELAYIASIWNA